MKELENQIRINENKRDRAYKRYLKTNNTQDWMAYDNYEKTVNILKKALHYLSMAENKHI